MPQAMKIPDAKAAVGKECEKLETMSAWQLDKVKKQGRCHSGTTKREERVHFATSMDICHLKNAESEPKRQKGRVVLRGDIVKDDSGACAVFTEEGSSTSQMTEAKVVDVIARLPGCAGQGADAASACTQVKKEGGPRLLKVSKSGCPDIWIRLPRHKRPRSRSNIEDTVVLLNEICMDTYLLAS